MSVRILLLGPVAAVDDAGHEVRVGGPQQRRLLAALALDLGRPVAVGRLVDLLWTESVPDDAVSALQTYVSRLRHDIGRDAVLSSDVGYGLNRAVVDTDAAVFERLLARARESDPMTAISLVDEALRLWRGPALGAFASEWWARSLAEHLDDVRLAALGERLDLILSLDRVAEAVTESELLVDADPLRESFVRQRMMALHRAGRSVEALRTAASFRHRLGDQVGLDASPELARLESQILAHDPGLAAQTRTTLHGYRLGALLAEGAHGAVYAATQPGLGREVAVKVVRQELADQADFVRRFEAEAQLVARLEHPCIVPLYDYWREPGGAYLVFRYLGGGSLQQRLAKGIVPIEDLDVLVDRIGGALAVAHRSGVAHRDVRAVNVLYDLDGFPYLTDFGIASESVDEDTITGDVITFAQLIGAVLARLASDQPDFAAARSVVRRGGIGEFSSVGAFVAEWKMARGFALATSPSPDRVRPRHRPNESVDNPYRGLRAFVEADRDVFFGRENATQEVAELVRERSYLCVVGPSGAGKSSLVLAGLVPCMRENGYFVTTMTPGVRPLNALRNALRRVATVEQSNSASNDPGTLLHVMAQDGPLLLVIDQLEELWTIGVEDDRRAFIELITAELATDGSQLHVVATIRADFYDRPLGDQRLGRFTRDGSVPLAPLDAAELERAVISPLQRTGVEIEDGLVARLITDGGAHPGSLPLFQFTLSNLFDARQGNQLTNAAYNELGGVAGAVATEAETLYQELSPSDQEHLHRLLAALITPGDGTDDTRRRALQAEFPDVPMAIFERLGAARLITFDRNPSNGEPTVELAHEALLLHWPRLGSWVDADRAELLVRRHLHDAATGWIRAQREPSHLFRGARLGEVDNLDTNLLPLDDQEFLSASKAQRTRELNAEHRRLHRAHALLGVTAVLLTAAIIAGGLAVAQRARANHNAALAAEQARVAVTQADQARSSEQNANTLRDAAITRNLITASDSTRTTDLPLSLLLAAEAHRRRDDDASRAALFTTLASNEPVQRFWWSPTGIEAVALADGGTRIVAAHADGSIEQRNAVDGALIGTPFTVTNEQGSTARTNINLAVTTDGTRAVVSASDDSVTLWSLTTSKEIRQLMPSRVGPGSNARPTHEVIDVRNGRVLVTSDDGTIHAFKDTTGADDGVLTSVPGHPSRLATDERGDIVAVAYEADAVLTYRVLDLDGTPRAEHTLDVGGGSFAGWAMSPDGTTLAASTLSGGVGIYDAASGNRRSEIDHRTVDAALVFIANNRLLVAQERALILDTTNGATIAGPYAVSKGYTVAAADPDSNRAVIADSAGIIARLDLIGDTTLSHDVGILGSVAIPDLTDRHLAVATFDGGAVVIDMTTGQSTPALRTAATAPSPLPTVVQSLAFNPDGTELGVSGLTGTIDIFDTTTGALRRSLPVAPDPHPDPAIAAAFGNLSEKRTGALTWSPDGHTLVVGQDSQVQLIDAQNSTTRTTLVGYSGLSWFGPGRQLLTTGPNGTSLLEATGSVIFDHIQCNQQPAVLSTWVPGANPLVATYPAPTSPGAICRLDPATGNTELQLRTAAVVAPQVSADGTYYAGISLNPVETWLQSAASGSLFGKLPGLGILLHNGHQIAVSRNGRITMTTLDPTTWQKAACQIAGRNLTTQEWAQYVGDEPYQTTCPSL
jgi:DNA-binding SARP family transcriptional activator/WD40 repeat protein/tRNA A-37 threonylcarbamoyl transferase component Bud32